MNKLLARARKHLLLVVLLACLLAFGWMGWHAGSGNQVPPVGGGVPAGSASATVAAGGTAKTNAAGSLPSAQSAPRPLSAKELEARNQSELKASWERYMTARSNLLKQHPEIPILTGIASRMPSEPAWEHLDAKTKEAFLAFRQANPEFMSAHFRQIGKKTQAQAISKVSSDPAFASILTSVFENTGLKQMISSMLGPSDVEAGYPTQGAKGEVPQSYQAFKALVERRIPQYEQSLQGDVQTYGLPPEVVTVMQAEWEMSFKSRVLELYRDNYFKSGELHQYAVEADRWVRQFGNDPSKHSSPQLTSLLEQIKMDIEPSL